MRKITLLLPTFTGDNDDLKHLFFLLTDPCFDGELNQENAILLVNCSSVKPDKPHDNACYIEQGEHEFIKHRSYIVYKQARIETLEKIERGISTGRFIKKEIINDELYKRILKGAFTSSHIERRYIRFIKSAITQNACLDVTNFYTPFTQIGANA